MIILYQGARGRGKTLSAVKDLYLYHKEGFRVIANFKTKFAEYIENEDLLKLDKNSNIDNCVLCVDEVGVFFDSRSGQSASNKKFSYFLNQIRKRQILVLMCAQFSHQIDKRIRSHLDIIAYPHYIKSLQVCEVTYLDLTRLNDNMLYQQDFTPSVKKVVFNAQPIFKLYNTNELIV